MKWNKLACLAVGAMLLASAAMADEAIIDGRTSDRVHLREGRSAVSASQGLFFTGTRVLCEAEPVGEWVSVTIGAQTGYMKAEYLLRGSMGGASVAKKTGAALTSTFLWQKPDPSSSALAAVKAGDALVLLGETHDGWYYVQLAGTYGYVPADAIEGEAAVGAVMPFSQTTSWVFSSGAGAWATTISLEPDGSFTGNYADSDMGDTGMNYANGTFYTCYFSGKMSQPIQVGNLCYQMVVEQLTWDVAPDTVWFEDGVRYISTLPFGLTQGDVLTLYQPGASVSLMTDDEMNWVFQSLDNDFVLTPVLVNETQEVGFCQY